jgi:hypothetical protein
MLHDRLTLCQVIFHHYMWHVHVFTCCGVLLHYANVCSKILHYKICSIVTLIVALDYIIVWHD